MSECLLITGYKIKSDGKLCVPFFLPYDAFMICIICKSDMHNYLLVNQKGENPKFDVTFPFIVTLRYGHTTTKVLNMDST